MYEKILVPVDGSEVSKKAADVALAHAELYDAEVHILHILPHTSGTSVVEPAHGLGISYEQVVSEGENLVENIKTDLKKEYEDSTIETSVDVGSPFRLITKYGDEHGIDIIIMGTSGKSGAERFLLGSTTERVIRSTDLPVLTVQKSSE